MMTRVAYTLLSVLIAIAAARAGGAPSPGPRRRAGPAGARHLELYVVLSMGSYPNVSPSHAIGYEIDPNN